MTTSLFPSSLPLLMALAIFLTMSILHPSGMAETRDLGDGFADHGVASPYSTHRGYVATVDGQGRNVLLVWLFDYTGGYALLMIDAETGAAEQFAIPFQSGGDTPYASILSSDNRFYTHFNSHFIEFDPAKPGFTFHRATEPKMAMSMTEDHHGVIWSVTYPKSGVVSYDPRTETLTDYGHVHDENWAQYQRSVATDDAGWVYFGLGTTASQVIGLNSQSGEALPMLPDDERTHGTGFVMPGTDGKVYGHAGEEKWYALHGGQATPLDGSPPAQPRRIITGDQTLAHNRFPDGSEVMELDLLQGTLAIKAPGGEPHHVSFNYASEGAYIMGVEAAPDGTISGGTTFPMRFFSFAPSEDAWVNRPLPGQANTLARRGDAFYTGEYPYGRLYLWDTAQPWASGTHERPDSGTNPVLLAQASPSIYRPHDLLVLPDGKTVVMTGTPNYGLTGGGLLLYDVERREADLIPHDRLVPDHSTMSLAALPDGLILGGTTISAGSGGQIKAERAELYILDTRRRQVIWHEAPFPDTRVILDLLAIEDGPVLGMTGGGKFFVFDPAGRRVVHEQETAEEFGPPVAEQGPRTFVSDDNGNVYILFSDHIVAVRHDPLRLEKIATTPTPISAGGTWLNGRLYFASRSRLHSFALPQ